MERRMKNQTNSMDAVTRFCLENPLIIALIAALGAGVTALGVKVQSILALSQLQEANKKGVTKRKKQMLKALLTLGSGMAEAGQAYSSKNGLTDLFDELRFPVGTLYNGKSFEAINAAKHVYDLLLAIPKADRDPFGLTDAVLASYLDSILDYQADDKSTTDVRIMRKAQTAHLKTMVQEGMVIMRDQVVKTAGQLQESHPEFYVALVDAARVINPNTHTKVRFVATDDVTALPLAEVKVIVDATGETAVTDKDGKCSIYMAFGTYALTFERENYLALKTERKVKRGANTMHVELSPKFILPAEVADDEKVNVEK